MGRDIVETRLTVSLRVFKYPNPPIWRFLNKKAGNIMPTDIYLVRRKLLNLESKAVCTPNRNLHFDNYNLSIFWWFCQDLRKLLFVVK